MDLGLFGPDVKDIGRILKDLDPDNQHPRTARRDLDLKLSQGPDINYLLSI